jgi:hypothetical protein
VYQVPPPNSRQAVYLLGLANMLQSSAVLTPPCAWLDKLGSGRQHSKPHSAVLYNIHRNELLKRNRLGARAGELEYRFPSMC